MSKRRYGAHENLMILDKEGFQRQQNRQQNVEVSRPARPANLESDLLVIVGQAGVPSLFATLIIEIIAWFIADKTGLSMAFKDYLMGGLLFFCVAFLLLWTSLLKETRKLLWAAERVLGDLNGDGNRGKPSNDTVKLESYLKDESGGVVSGAKRTMPFSREKFIKFLRGCEYKGLGIRAWTGKAGLFTDAQFETLMGFLHEAGYIEWASEKDRRQGRQFTRAGKAAIRNWKQKLPNQSVLSFDN